MTELCETQRGVGVGGREREGKRGRERDGGGGERERERAVRMKTLQKKLSTVFKLSMELGRAYAECKSPTIPKLHDEPPLECVLLWSHTLARRISGIR